MLSDRSWIRPPTTTRTGILAQVLAQGGGGGRSVSTTARLAGSPFAQGLHKQSIIIRSD